MTGPLPYIRVEPFLVPPSSDSAGDLEYHALLAAQIDPRSFEDAASRKWGFGDQSLMQEVQERQLVFLHSLQHREPADIRDDTYRTLALRYIRPPGDTRLHMILLAKVHAPTERTAYQRGIELWRELQSLFPYDFRLLPLQSPSGFDRAVAWSWLEDKSATVVAVRRREAFVSTRSGVFYLPGRWQSSLPGSEQVWRALSGCDGPLLLNILLRPVTLSPREEVALHETVQELEDAGKAETIPYVLSEVKRGIARYRQSALSYRSPFLLQVHVVGRRHVPDHLPHAIGTALTSGAEITEPRPAYHVSRIDDENGLVDWRHCLQWLHPLPDQGGAVDERFARMRDMVDLEEAHAVFKLPFLPKGGIPGVNLANGRDGNPGPGGPTNR